VLLQPRAELAVIVHEHFGVGRKLHAEASAHERRVAAENDARGGEAAPRNADKRGVDRLRGIAELMAPAEAKLGRQRLRLTEKSVIGEVTAAKLPLSGGSATMTFLKTVCCVAKAARLPVGLSSNVPPLRLIVPALKVG
jgi:hypothetical protein